MGGSPRHISKTIPRRQLAEDPRIVRIADDETFVEHWRPRTRAECADLPRPCPFVGCRYHTFLETTPSGGVALTWLDLYPWEVEASCVLDVAEGACGRGKDERGHTLPGSGYHRTLEEVGRVLNLTRERVRQIEERALAKIESALECCPVDGMPDEED